VSFAATILCVASQRVFIVVYFVIDSVRKLLVTPPCDMFIDWCLDMIAVRTTVRSQTSYWPSCLSCSGTLNIYSSNLLLNVSSWVRHVPEIG
jgi:hypothetical protein